MESVIKWQTGTPQKTGNYLVTISYGKGIYGTRSDYFHTEDGWTYYNDGSVVAWCDLKYVEPYNPIE